MRQPEFNRELRAIRDAARADLADRLTCVVLALVMVVVLILPMAGLLHGLLAHLQAVLVAAVPR